MNLHPDSKTRLLRYGPLAVNLVLAAAIAWLIADMVLPWLPAGAVRQAAPPVPPTGRIVTAAKRPALPAIESWHLFGRAGANKPPPAAIRNAPETRLKLTLRGILADDSGKASLAIIQKERGQEKFFRIGQEIFGLATLEEIHADRVVLLRNGRYETLRLPEERLPLAKPKHGPGRRLKLTDKQRQGLPEAGRPEAR